VTDPQPTGKPNARMKQTVGDMIRSLAVVLAVVGALLLVTWRPSPDPVRVVDIDPLVIVASAQAEYPIVVPDLEGLRPTSVRWEPTEESVDIPVWHVGFVTQDDQYLEVTQSTASDPLFLERETGNGEIAGLVDIDGQQWQYFTAETGNSLVGLEGGVTTIIQGTGTESDLREAVQSLVPAIDTINN
jgi:hypothetical protein